MKATLEFDLPEDNDNYIAAVHGMDYALVCWDMDQKLRGWLKYGHKFIDAEEALEACREQLREIMDSHSVHMDMIK